MLRKISSSYFRSRAVAFLILALLAAHGCRAREEERGATVGPEIVVAAAANLSDAFVEMCRRFTARTGVRVILSFGATGDLARQVENGAPFDVFASADVRHLDELEKKGFIKAGSRVIYARGRLVLWTPPRGSVRLERVGDVTGARVTKIAVAKPDIAPYGRAAVEALRALNIWEEVEPKIVYAQNASQARQFAATGNADAAFIPLSLVKDGEGDLIEIDERLHGPVEQALGIVSRSEEQQSAQQFADFVLSEEGQALLESHGYGRGVAAKLGEAKP
jgi:molybdate transport system substrate-binding protein